MYHRLPCSSPIAPQALAFAQARGTGTVCAWSGNKPVASSVPFILTSTSDGTPLAAFHVARGNPLAGLADGTSSWLLAVNGADAYVSADWYAFARPGADLALSGRASDGTGAKIVRRRARSASRPAQREVRRLAGAEIALDIVENDGGPLDALKKAIVGMVMTVEEVEGSFKLNQHKSDVDYAAIASALLQRDDEAAQTIGKEMVALRPHLDYKSSTPVSVSAD